MIIIILLPTRQIIFLGFHHINHLKFFASLILKQLNSYLYPGILERHTFRHLFIECRQMISFAVI